MNKTFFFFTEELRGILRNSRKRLHKSVTESSPIVKKEPNTNGIAAKNPWGFLSENWGVTDFVEDDYLHNVPPPPSVEPTSRVKDRLGFRPLKERRDLEVEERDSNIIELSDSQSAESESESESSDEENWCTRSKMPRMRMHADDEEEKLQKRKGKIRSMVC